MPLNDGRFSRRYRKAPAGFSGPWLGVDVGVSNLLIDSEGTQYPLGEEDRLTWRKLTREALELGIVSVSSKRAVEDLCARTAKQVIRKAARLSAGVALEKLIDCDLDPILKLAYNQLSGALAMRSLKTSGADEVRGMGKHLPQLS